MIFCVTSCVYMQMRVCMYVVCMYMYVVCVCVCVCVCMLVCVYVLVYCVSNYAIITQPHNTITLSVSYIPHTNL